MKVNAAIGGKTGLPNLEIEDIEPHYSTAEVARALKLSEDTTRKIFGDEAGVVRIAKPSKRRRKYVTLRIPRSVFLKVYSRLQASPKAS
jgi:AraC-like DNA-binding protein